MIRAAVGFWLAFSLSWSQAVQAAPIDDRTTCAAATGRDQADFAAYVQQVFEKLDDLHASNGEPEVLPHLLDRAMPLFVMTVMAECQAYPQERVYNAASGMYRNTRDTMRENGTIR